ncbi:MAG: Swt1 family HEPN domain-containing protein [Gemmatimonadaceae bacterium]
MDTTERAAVRRALDELKPFLAAYLTQRGIVVPSPTGVTSQKAGGGDIQALLKACLSAWEQTLRRELPNVAKSYIHELIDIRNRWAHEEPFTRAETDRATDTARQLGALIGAPASARAAQSLAAPEPTRTLAPKATRASAPRETQRDVMSRIFVACDRDIERAIREYAAAERRGEVLRKSNKHGISAEDYARALIADGEKKGWL